MWEGSFFKAFVYSHYLYYSIFAYLVLLFRIVKRDVSIREIMLALLFLCGMIFELIQLVFEGGKPISFSVIETTSFQRYFGCLAPILWIWTAFGVYRLSVISGTVGIGLKILFMVIYPLIVVYDSVSFFSDFYKRGLGEDALVAARRIAPIIERDYAGERRRKDMTYSVKEYFTANRPAVFSNFGVAALLVKGQAEGPNYGIYPYPPDYLFLNMNCGGYSQGGKRFNPKDYDFLYETRGTRCRWALFRRKGVLHRKIIN